MGLSAQNAFTTLKVHHENTRPKYYFSFDIPQLDLALFSNTEAYDDGKKKIKDEDIVYGVPSGKLTEIAGNSGSFKTTLAMYLAADCLKQGGMVFWLSTEGDLDYNYLMEICHGQFGIPKKVVEENVFPAYEFMIDGAITRVNKFTKLYSKLYEEEGPRPAMLVLDSLGALTNENTVTTADKHFEDEKTEGIKTMVGEQPKMIHHLMKKMMKVTTDLDIAFVMTNHMRSNIGGMKKTKVAHDQSVQFYPSLRIQVSAWNSGKKTTNLGREWKRGSKVKVSIAKLRSSNSTAYETELLYVYDHGFDLIESFGQTLLSCGVVKNSTKPDVAYMRDGTALRDEVVDYMVAKIPKPVSNMDQAVSKMVKKQLKEDPEGLSAWYQKALTLCRVTGIDKLPDQEVTIV